MRTKLNFTEINTILLDMDGTLLDLHYDNYFWREHLPLRYSEINHISLDEAKDQLVPKFKAMEGTLEWYCLDYWSKELQLNIPELKSEITHLISIHDGVIEFLQAMRKLKKSIYLVTNAHKLALELKMNKTKLHHQFDKIISSHQFGVPKENKDFWQLLIEKYKFDPQTTLFVDDSIPVLDSAKSFGIKHIVAISKPSSQDPPVKIKHYQTIEKFGEITPEE